LVGSRVQAAIDAAALLKHLKTFRLIGLNDKHELAPLQRCASLRSLYLRMQWYDVQRMSDEQTDVLRRMPQLKQLAFGMLGYGKDTDAWVHLLSTPPYPPLQSITVAGQYLYLNPALIALLPRLSSLTELHVCVNAPNCLAGVERVSSLRSLDLQIRPLPLPRGMVRLARTIRACHGLQKLALSPAAVDPTIPTDEADNIGQAMSSALLSSCLAGLPELHTLQLTDMKISSLAFLSRATLQRSLTHLSLVSLDPRMPPEELLHVFGLKALQVLSLERVLAEPLPADMAYELRSPSVRLPALLRSNVSAAFVEEVDRDDRAHLGMALLAEEAYGSEEDDA
jgi:hypothetical protein